MSKPASIPSSRATLLLVGDGEPLSDAITDALRRHAILVERARREELLRAVVVAAPDLVVLCGDATRDRGESALRLLAADPVAAVAPVALLLEDASLDERLRAFRSGAVAVIQRSASAHAIAERIAKLCMEIPERPGEATGELGEATLDELSALIARKLRSGILSVEQEGTDSAPLRLVLGSGGDVADAVDAFVDKLRPLVADAKPLRYELFEAAGGRMQLWDEVPEGSAEGIFTDLRIVVMDDDPGRADEFAHALRGRGALVAITEVSERGIARAQQLDPAVIVIDAGAIQGAGFEVVRRIRRDPRLRWASMLVAKWEELWPQGAAAPDLETITRRLTPLVSQDRALSERCRGDAPFDTRLELTGPSRMLRAIASIEGSRVVATRSPRVAVDVDMNGELLVSAQGRVDGETVEGTEALQHLLTLGSGRVRIEKRTHPAAANIMLTVDEALNAAVLPQAAPSSAPPPLVQSPASEPPRIKTSSLPPRIQSSASAKASSLPPPVAAARRSLETHPPIPRADDEPTLSSEASSQKAMDSEAARTPLPPPSRRPRNKKQTQLGIGAVQLPTSERPTPTPEELEEREAAQSDRPKAKVPSGPPSEPAKRALAFLGGGPSSAPPGPPDPEETFGGGDTMPAPPLAEQEQAEQALESLADASDDIDAAELATELAAEESESAAPAFTPPPAPPRPVSEPPFDTDEPTDVIPRPSKGKGRGLAVAVALLATLGAGAFAATQLRPEWFGLEEPVETPPTEPPHEPPPEEGPPTENVGEPENPVAENGTEATDPDGPENTTTENAGAENAGTENPENAAENTTAENAGSETPSTEAEAETADPPNAESASDEAIEALSDRERGRRSDDLARDAERAIADGDLGRAGTLTSEALRYEERNPQAVAARARYFMAAGNAQAGIQWAERATRRRPRRAAYQVLLGDAHRLGGAADAARAAYRRALELDPDNRTARNRLQ